MFDNKKNMLVSALTRRIVSGQMWLQVFVFFHLEWIRFIFISILPTSWLDLNMQIIQGELVDLSQVKVSDVGSSWGAAMTYKLRVMWRLKAVFQ